MQYCPVTLVNDPNINQILGYIWQCKADRRVNLVAVQNTNYYEALARKFPAWQSVIDEAIKDMIDAAKNFASQPYHLDESTGRIGYQDQDRVSYEMTYGYKTTYAYFAEYAKGKLTDAHLNANLNIQLNSGFFSYAEMPKLFDKVIGVTGTLDTLCPEQIKVIKEDYQITMLTFMPSVFGKNQRNFDKKNDVRIYDSDFYYQEIINEAVV